MALEPVQVEQINIPFDERIKAVFVTGGIALAESILQLAREQIEKQESWHRLGLNPQLQVQRQPSDHHSQV